ncbi:urea transporter [Paraburkholderia phymatum]|uniref:Urea transporter n=1 Tax=Paraburkholderia phymatum (strain DSM 17167 / CIP 108236 / LMG 21445 / STM815) TaxID=391038 RepID=B2JKZ2_PARP8|nr:urea transporter [Paraburkholderia phymatum]ACC72521.1 Urea transporter [Paraburkholderia phymatum STM815]
MPAAPHEKPLDALRTLLRSFGQIVLQRNAATGACVLAAWLVSDARLACAAFTGAIAANVGAMLRGYDCTDTRNGLHGFNGALAALAAFTFISDDARAMAVAILAATAAAWLLGPWERLLRSRGQGFYSSPCLLVTWAWLPFVRPVSAHAPASEMPGWLGPLPGLLAGIAQTSFASSALAGALIVVGIAFSSMRAARFALAGAALASSAQWLVAADSASFDAGLLGFNGALTALAVADCGVLAALAGVGVSVALQQATLFYGVPALTAPFVVATWTTRRIMRDTRRTCTNGAERSPDDSVAVGHRKQASRAALLRER